MSDRAGRWWARWRRARGPGPDDLAAAARTLRREGRMQEAAERLELALAVSAHEHEWRQDLCELLAELGRVDDLVAHARILAGQAEDQHEGESPGRVPRGRLEQVARLVVAAGQHEVGRRLLDGAVGDPPQPGPAVAKRRLLPGYLPPIDADLVERTARGLVDAPPDALAEPVSATPLQAGQGQAVEGVVRHVWRVGGREVRLVQKTLVGPQPREVLVHRDGVLPEEGERWRSVGAHHAEEVSPDRWHLLLEDLGKVRKPSTPRQIVDAARSLAELHGAALGARDRLAGHSWLFGGPDIDRVWAVPPEAAVAELPDEALPAALRAHAVDVLSRFHEAGSALDTLTLDLPSTLLHGDTGLGNVVERTDPDGRRRMVWFDWEMVQVGPVGADLAQLLLGRVVRHPRRDDPTVVERAVAAYATDLAAYGVDEGQVWAGYRLGVTRRMLRLKTVPLRRLATGASEPGGPSMGSRAHRLLLEDLELLCDEGDRLLRSI